MTRHHGGMEAGGREVRRSWGGGREGCANGSLNLLSSPSFCGDHGGSGAPLGSQGGCLWGPGGATQSRPLWSLGPGRGDGPAASGGVGSS